jgi:hypothetical protein
MPTPPVQAVGGQRQGKFFGRKRLMLFISAYPWGQIGSITYATCHRLEPSKRVRGPMSDPDGQAR